MAQEISQRQLRVGREIRRIIAASLERGEIRSPEISGAFITVTQVVMSPDLKYATIYIMTLNGKNLGVVLEQLNADKWVFKKTIASKLKLRYTPEINFRVDDTYAEADRISRLMRDPKVMADISHSERTEESSAEDE